MTDDLRRRVLDASAALVAAQGLDALSMREVARRAGVSHQAPYHHFRDREGILAALVEEGFAGLADALEAAGGGAAGGGAADGAPTPPERLAATGVAYVRFALAHPGHFRVLFRPDLVPLDRWPAARAAAERAYAPLARAVDACIAAGHADPADREALSAAAWALVHGLAALLLDGPLADPAARAALPERATALFAALLARPPVAVAAR